MLFSYFSLGSCKSLLDLQEPFRLDENSTINTWSFFGNTQIYSDQIVLLPPIRRSKGSMWSKAILPDDSWSIRVDLTVIQPHEELSFALFYTSDAASDTSFNGGPSAFKGLAIIGEFIRINETTKKFTLNSLQSDGSIDLRTVALPNPDLTFDVEDDFTFGLIFGISNNQIYTAVDPGDGQLIRGSRQKAEFDYSEFYLGLTAQNKAYESGLLLSKLQLSMEGDISDKSHDMDNFYQPETHTNTNDSYYDTLHYKHNAFKEMEKQYTLGRAASYNVQHGGLYNSTSYSTVLDLIDEAFKATESMATFKNINEYIKTDLAKYVQDWQGVMTEACRSMGEVNKSIYDNYVSANDMLGYFNQSVNQVFKSIFKSSRNFTNELINLSKVEIKFDLPKKTSILSYIFIFICVIELFVTFFLFTHMDEITKAVHLPGAFL